MSLFIPFTFITFITFIAFQFSHLIYFGPKELLFITGRSNARGIVPQNNLSGVMEHDVIDVLPTVYALRGCDTTSKIVTKAASLKVASKYGHELLYLFGKVELTDEIITDAEKFLWRRISLNE